MAEERYGCSPLDSMIPALFNALILTFSCASSQKDVVLSLLQQSLDSTVQQRPYLLADVISSADSNLEHGTSGVGPAPLYLEQRSTNMIIEVNDMSKDSEIWQWSYKDLKTDGVPPSKMLGDLLAPSAGYKTSTKVMAVRANFIPDGLLLAVYFQHSFLDAYGASLVMAAWAENCRSLQPCNNSDSKDLVAPLEIKLPEVLEKSSIQPSREVYEQLKSRPELWRSMSLEWRGRKTSAPFAQTAKMVTCVFNANQPSLNELKAVTTQSLSPTEPAHPKFLSTADALGALLWRCILKARYPSSGRQATRDSIINVALDGRLGLGIPMNYVGNVVFGSITSMSVSHLTSSSTGVGEVAIALRNSLEATKQPNNLSDALRLASSIPTNMQLQYAIPDWGSEDVVFTSWERLGFYKHNWGPAFGQGGQAEFFRMPTGQFEGICSVQPRRQDGSLDVVVGLQPQQMELFRKDPEILEFLTFVSQ